MKPNVTIVLLAIFAIAFFLRFYSLGDVPYGFYQDESAIGYNAYSLIETQRDEHGRVWPIYFQSFGDYKLPVYIYLTAISVKIFGLTELAVRFPSALFSFLTVVVFYFFVKAMTNNKKLSLVATLLLAINPWHIHYGRATFEVSISLFLFVFGTLLIHNALKNSRKNLFLIGTLCFVIALYTYNLTRLLSPLLFIVVLFLNREKLRLFLLRDVILLIVISGMLLFPFFSTFLQEEGVDSAKGTLIFSSAKVIAPLLEFRSYLISLPMWFTKLFFNSPILIGWEYLNHIASYFSATFLFISGSPHGNHGIGNVGQFYLFELPFMLWGAIKIIREKLRWGKLLFCWAIVVVLVAALTRESSHATRSFFLIVPLVIVSAVGLLSFVSFLDGQKVVVKRVTMLVLLIVIIYNITYYLTSYYIRFPVAYATAWRLKDKEVSLYIRENEHKYDKIVFDNDAGFVYTSLLFYHPYPPDKFQKEALYYPSDSEGFSNIRSFGKYEFREIDWMKDYSLKKALFITSEKGKPPGLKETKVFYYPKRPVVLALGQKLFWYDVSDVAYVAIESNTQK